MSRCERTDSFVASSALDDLLEVLEHVPDALGRVVDVVEVDLEVLGHVALACARGRCSAARCGRTILRKLMISCLTSEMSRTISRRAALEDVVLDALELVAHLAEHRERGVDAVVDDLVEQVAGALAEQLLAHVLARAAALEEVLERLQRLVGQRDDEVGPDEDVELGRVQAADGLVEAREVQDDEEVVLVLVDLRALVAREDVLVVERVEVEVLLEPGAIDRARALDVDPAQTPAASTISTFGALRLRRAGRRLRAHARPGAVWAVGRFGIGTSRLVGRVMVTLGRPRSSLLRASRAHSWTHPEGWRDWPYETPATISRSRVRRCQFLTDVAEGQSDLRHDEPRRDLRWQPEVLRCRECGAEYPLEARYVCERCFGPLEVAYDHPQDRRRRRACAAASRAGRRTSGATPTSCRWRRRPARRPRLTSRAGLPAGCTPLIRADRLAERLGLREVWVKNDAANPTHSFKDRVVSVAVARARELGFETLACASTGNLANSVAAHGAALGLETYVFIPADLEEQKILATGVYGTNLVEGPRQLRRRQPPLHRALRRARLGVRERQHAPVLRRGLQDAGLRDRRAARLAARRTACVAPIASGSLFTKIAKGFEEWLELGLVDGDAPGHERRAGRRAARRSPPPSPTGPTSAARSSPTRSPSRWRSATRPTARTRSSSRARSGGGDRRGLRRRDPRRHPPARRDDRHLHRDRRRRDDRDAGQARRARRHRPRRARRRSSSPARA